MNEGIKNSRAEINAIDAELLRLLNERVEIALKVGEVKRRDEISLCDHNREQEVLATLAQQNTGPLSEQNVTSIFRRIMEECLHAQQIAFGTPAEDSRETEVEPNSFTRNVRVAVPGEHGSFSEEAAIKLLGETCCPVPRSMFENVFTAIDEKSADYILIPLENSLVGSVRRCYDLLLESTLIIAAEIICPISHFLIGCPGASLESVKTVESHPVALAQCELFFAAHPHIERVSASDAESSVRRVVENRNPAKAAIGGRRAANIYGGVILQERLEDNSENYTRFVLLAPKSSVSNQGNKISLMVRLPHQPGALHNALRPFVRRGIDLLKIEGRPIRGRPWQYNFCLDLQAPASKSELQGALDEIGEQAEELRHLGQYFSISILDDK